MTLFSVHICDPLKNKDAGPRQVITRHWQLSFHLVQNFRLKIYESNQNIEGGGGGETEFFFLGLVISD